MNKGRIIALIVLLAIFTAGCKNDRLFESVVSLPKEGWKAKDFVQFEVTVQDTLSEFQIDLSLRNDGRYAYSNLFLFIHTLAPTGAQIRDTIECTLADRSGKWLGRGIGGQYSYEIPYKTRVRFPYPGVYRFEIQQGMRQDPLPFITDVGLSIKAQKK